MQLERLTDAAAVALRAADLVGATVAANPEAVLLLPAGATPVPLYAELVRRARAGALDLSRAHLFQLDEIRGVGPDDTRGFHAFLRTHLVEPLGLGERFHGLDGSRADAAGEIERHRLALERVGPADLVLLGLGRNGHVAFNEPGSTLADRARVVTLAVGTVSALARDFPGAPPREGLTLGMAEIAAGRALVLLVTGTSKAPVLAEILAFDRSDLPAALLASHPACLALADEDAVRGRTQSGI